MAAFEDITFIAEERLVSRSGKAVRLSPVQFAVFDSLLFCYPKLRSLELLYDDAYGAKPENEQPDPKIVGVILYHLRKKLAPIGVTIVNVPWTGWKLATRESVRRDDVADRVVELEKALRCALEHIEHMAAWIGRRNAGYSFESLGEDIGDLRDALRSAADRQALGISR